MCEIIDFEEKRAELYVDKDAYNAGAEAVEAMFMKLESDGWKPELDLIMSVYQHTVAFIYGLAPDDESADNLLEVGLSIVRERMAETS